MIRLHGSIVQFPESYTFKELFLQFSFGDLNLDRLIDLFCMATSVIRIVLYGGRKKGVDEGCFS